MNALALLGFAAVSLMLFRALEGSSPWFVLAFAGSGVMRSAYGVFAQGLALRAGGGRVVAGGPGPVAHTAHT